MRRDDSHFVQDSREGGRVWILVVLLTLIWVGILGVAVSRSIATSADMISRANKPHG
jgi:hypothetical protein